MRNLDITTLRSFVAVAEAGGVTRAAGYLHLTQSAVSMQLKRLEELLGLALFDRSGRTIALTASGEQLLAYARRMVALNDEVMSRLTDQAFEGEITLGVPHDIVYPAIPQVLKQFHAAYPRVKVHLDSSNTKQLKAEYAKGELDMILTTEIDLDAGLDPGAEELCVKPLIWIGAPNGSAWRQRPLRLAVGRQCTFRPRVIECLDAAQVPWDIVVESDSDHTIEATVSADLAVHTVIEGTIRPDLEKVDHNGLLPELPAHKINLYGGSSARNDMQSALADVLRRTFGGQDAALMRVV